MPTKCEKCPLRGLPLFLEFSRDELDYMQRFKTGEMIAEPGTHLLSQGEKSPQLFTVLSGMGLKYKMLKDGSRQVVGFVMPGDFLGLQAGVMGKMGHSVEAVTDMTLCVFNRAAIWELFSAHPERSFAIAHLAAVEEHFLGDALAAVGQRPAYEKIAWAMARFFNRAQGTGLAVKNTAPLPFTQQDLADGLGLSLVHTNKQLAKLRRDGVASWQKGTLTVHNRKALLDIAGEESEVECRPLM
ncbi:Crp/Fnr family transcriptional regulator [Cognatishimia maritima]|uniref:cAMP-binding domain of CRP or a regulatory subunit of cAMP-dependent protein kinases n=1 Tax=Cognatishimia maritima TaxID=870908 RepID=A0A1M5PK48_9RHOB|nr:cAMP-binding domain of CRP or a regulatory subunit of cAMP-dependent protein kinases [Cognatishimia maritima]